LSPADDLYSFYKITYPLLGFKKNRTERRGRYDSYLKIDKTKIKKINPREIIVEMKHKL